MSHNSGIKTCVNRALTSAGLTRYNLQKWRLDAAVGLCRAYGKWKLSHTGALDLLNSRPSDAIHPDYNDLWFLYRCVRERKPSCILEFGSGCSTFVLAQAAKDNLMGAGPKSAKVVSVDADSRWASEARNAIPASLKDFCEVHHIPAIEVDYEDEVPALMHEHLPDVVPEIIYVDGPALTSDRKIAVDVLSMQDVLPKGCLIIFDGRKKNACFIRDRIRRKIEFRERPCSAGSTISILD